MLQAMFSGVSGLQAHQTRLDVIGNNIANVNTIGFKAGRVTFEDQLSQTLRNSARPSTNVGGQNPSQVGLGVSLGAVDTLQTQGNLQTTGKSTDLAIQGSGFFLVSSGDNTYYTRDGSFDLDSDGVVVNPASGMKLLGYTADSNGKIDTTQQITANSAISIPVGTLTAVKPTSAATFQGNLDASSSQQSTNVALNGNLDLSTIPPVLTNTVYDAGGNAHTLVTTFSNPTDGAAVAAGPGVPTGVLQRWSVSMTIDSNSVPLSPSQQNIYAVPGATAGSPNQFIFTDTSTPGNSVGTEISVNVTGANGAANFPLSVSFKGLTANSSVTSAADGQAGTNPIDSKIVSLKGALNTSDAAAVTNTVSVYKSGTQYTITSQLSNPVYRPAPGPNVPAGATEKWDLKVSISAPSANAGTVYDSSVAGNQESAVYFVPGQGYVLADGANPATPLGSIVQLVGGPLPAGSFNQGQQADTGFNLNVDLSSLSNTKIATQADGQTGSASVSNASLTVYDSLGVSHDLSIKYTRALVGAGSPVGAAGRWEWSVSEVDNKAKSSTLLTDSTQAGNKPLFFDTKGGLINGSNPTIQLTPKNGAAPLSVKLDFSAITQLSNTSSVAATTQDGFQVGTLQTFAISPTGLITGIFTNGQSRTLGQVAMASFSNPAGLEKKGQNLFSSSSNSGLAQVGEPSQGGRGQISTGYVEMSNVDLSTEFTNLIITQRGFQANTRIITIVDDLLQDVINLKRA